MKYLILLLLASCAFNPKFNNPAYRMKSCMLDFANQGYDSEALVRICEKIHERRH